MALPDQLPTNIHLSELPNPTWVLDLGSIIPTAITAALMLRRRHPAGPVVAGAMLVLVVFTVLFTVLGGIEIWLLTRARRRLDVVASSWLRRGWWPETR